jgi:cytochrome c
MFDTMTVTKVGGALCGALLVFLLINWAADGIYSTGGGHGDHAEAAYVIPVEDSGSADAGAKEDGPSFADLLASADAAKGEKVFGKCKACHKIGAGENATGPSLHAVVGRAIGTEAGFSYSGGMSGHGDNWTPENLDHFLTKPKDFVPGTKMSFAGLKKADDRANLIAYLQTLGN